MLIIPFRVCSSRDPHCEKRPVQDGHPVQAKSQVIVNGCMVVLSIFTGAFYLPLKDMCHGDGCSSPTAFCFMTNCIGFFARI
jgi:hypothetical protein